MRVVCAPLRRLPRPRAGELQVVLYGYADRAGRGEAGASLLETIKKLKLQPADRAWDLLSLALAVNAADLAVQRSSSPDGWTRNLELQVAVCDPDFWNGQRELVERQLKFLTTDIWRVSFVGDGLLPAPPRPATVPTEDSVALLSGGMDSLVGALDLTGRDGLRPFAASQVAIGDKQIQADFARRIGNCLRHLQLNHNINAPDETERSQRARSLIFLAYGVLAATTLDRHSDGQTVPLYVSENGFISINPPLTAARIGSLSTRTTNPVFIRLFQELLNMSRGCASGSRIRTSSTPKARCSHNAWINRSFSAMRTWPPAAAATVATTTPTAVAACRASFVVRRSTTGDIAIERTTSFATSHATTTTTPDSTMSARRRWQCFRSVPMASTPGLVLRLAPPSWVTFRPTAPRWSAALQRSGLF